MESQSLEISKSFMFSKSLRFHKYSTFLTSLLASLAKAFIVCLFVFFFFTTYDLSDQKKKGLNFIGKISFGLKNFIPVF